MPHSGLKAKNENDPKEEDDLQWKTTFNGRRPSMEYANEDDLKIKKNLHIAGRHTALDIFRFAVFFFNCIVLFPIFSYFFIFKWLLFILDIKLCQVGTSNILCQAVPLSGRYNVRPQRDIMPGNCQTLMPFSYMDVVVLCVLFYFWHFN